MPRYRFRIYCLLCFYLLGAGVLATAELEHLATSEDIIGMAPDQYGYAVAMDNNSAIVGRPKDRLRGFQVGAAYLYERQAGTWVETARIRPQREPAHDFFGSAVAVQDDVAVIGAPGTQQERGAAYIFERRNGVWTQVQKLKASAARSKDAFGQAVAIAGEYVLVGAPGDDEAGQDAGTVYVFARQQGVWNPQAVQKLLASDLPRHTGFGATLAMSGTDAVVGAPQHDHGGQLGRDYGAAYVLQLRRGVWVEMEQLQASDAEPRDNFGSAVAISGQEVAIGAPRPHGRGAVYLFTRQASGWTATETDKVMSHERQGGDRFGAAVALSGATLLVGAYADDAEDGPDELLKNRQGSVYGSESSKPRQGSVYVFEHQATGWHAVARLTGSQSCWHAVGRRTGSQSCRHAHFGYALALMGEHALVGAPALLGGPDGRVYAYDGLSSNAIPEIHSTPGATATVGRLYNYQVHATDADHDPLFYALRQAPAGMSINGSTGLITWTPTAAGRVDVQITVQDDRGGAAAQAYSLSVQALNRPPHITSAPVTSMVMTHLIPQVTVSDAHAVRQSIMLNGQPYTPGTPVGTPGNYVLTVEATDVAGNTALKTIRFTLTTSVIP